MHPNPYDNSHLVILEGRGCNRFLRSWAGRFRHRTILNVSDFPDHVACHRNRVFKWFLSKSELPYLICVDDDVVPVPQTEAFVAAEGDVIGTRAWANTGSEMHPHAFSMTALKVHRRVVESVAPPWFAFEFAEDGSALVKCECLYFHDKVKQAGFEVETHGAVGHRFPVTVVPPVEGDSQDGRPRFLFDGDVEQFAKQRANERN